jgi:4-amino-4-deoxy-L-arabinose transferase-like glycosyltransferase
MAIIDFSTFSLYRWRYIIGYGVVGITLAGLLLFAGLFLPGGLSPTEIKTVISSDSLHLTDFSSFAQLNLPYLILQSLSMHIFGISTFTIKLPSLVLALLTAIGMIFLLRRWFSRNIAVLGSFIAITTGQFLFIAQSGTAGILYIFWPTVLLLLGTLITRSHRYVFIWKALFFIAAALSLYTPLSVYPLVGIIIASALHPHLRNVIRNLSKLRLVYAVLIGLAILSPLIYGVINNPSLGLSLLGVPNGEPHIIANFTQLAKQYLDFWSPSTTTLMTPVFGLGSLLLIAFGLLRLFRTRETTQSYLISSWLICLIPVLLVNPSFTSVTFLPLVLLLTAGLQGLISYWYRLFPKNPYARIAGLIPLVVLVGALVISGLDRYAYGYYYQPATATNFTKDLTFLPKNAGLVVVSQDELPFYQTVSHYRNGMSVSINPSGSQFVETRAAYEQEGKPTGYQITSIITSSSSQDADRFYLYKNAS